MSEQNWTPEPWGMGKKEDGAVCMKAGEGLVIHRPEPNKAQFRGADLRRILTCVNGCTDIANPENGIPALVRAARALINAANKDPDGPVASVLNHWQAGCDLREAVVLCDKEINDGKE